MSFNQNPVFRKAIVPWYDSNTACIIVIAFMFFVFLFSVAGTFEAHEKLEYHEYIWMPVLIALMSGWVIVSITIRLIKRYVEVVSW